MRLPRIRNRVMSNYHRPPCQRHTYTIPNCLHKSDATEVLNILFQAICGCHTHPPSPSTSFLVNLASIPTWPSPLASSCTSVDPSRSPYAQKSCSRCCMTGFWKMVATHACMEGYPFTQCLGIKESRNPSLRDDRRVWLRDRGLWICMKGS